MKLFITGAVGFVGTELRKQCGQRGIGYSAVDLVNQGLKDISVADIRQKSLADLIPEKADAVIHLAGLTRDSDCSNKAYDCFDANVMATLNLIDAAQRRNVKQFIFASTEWVYGEFKELGSKEEEFPIAPSKLKSEYAFSKFVSEINLIQKFQHGFCDTTILRFGIIYGNRKKNWSAVESIFNAVRTQDEVRVGSLKTGRCFIHVSDIVSGVLASVGLSGLQTLNLEGDKIITLGEIIDTSKRILGREPSIREDNPAGMNLRDISNKKAKQVLGWKPVVTLEQGLNQLNEFLLV